MLHSIDPIALILAPIRVGVRPKAMLLIELVVAFVATPILPHISAMAMHDSTLELALEVSTIGPLKASSTTHLILGPIASILTSIGPEVDSLALFLAIVKATQVVAAVTPHLNAFTILLVRHQPVGVRLSAELALSIEIVNDIVLAEDAEVGLLILLPDALENLIVQGTEHADANGLPIDPVPLKGAIIRPNELTIATFLHVVVQGHAILRVIIIGVTSLLSVDAGCRRIVHRCAIVLRNYPDLSNVLQLSKLNSLEAQLGVLQT